MDFRLGITKNDHQIIVKTFEDGKSPTSKVLDLNEIREQNLQAFFYLSDIKSEDLINQLESETKFYPVRLAQEFQLTADKFESLDRNDGLRLLEKARESWILQNNISFIEEIFKVRTHLNNLWPNDRTGFFEEFWFTLRSQLGASEITIIYNDMIKATKEGEKNKLIKVKVSGTRIPEPQSPNDADEVVYKHYEKELTQQLEITEYNKEKGHLVIAGGLKKSPVLIMAKVFGLTRIQKALLTSIIDGINS